MTVADVDTDVYVDAADALIRAADDFYAAVDRHWSKLAHTGEAMCGSYEEARTWADAYDTKANSLLAQVKMLANNVNGYGNILRELGWMHALADHNANPAPGPPPPEPTYPILNPLIQCRPPLPSVGGPGEGLDEAAIGLLEQIGITVPDGDTDKLWTVAAVWRDIAAEGAVADFADQITRAASMFAPITAPELDHIDEDLKALAGAAGETVASFAAMATTTSEHHDALVAMREDIRDILEQFVIAAAVEFAVTGAVTVAASVVTFGAAAAVGAAIGASRAAKLCAQYGPKIRPFINAFKVRGLGRGFNDVPDWSTHKQRMDQIWQMINKKSPVGRRRRTDWSFGPEDEKAIQTAAVRSPDSGLTLNEQLNRGLPLTPDEQRRADALNQALAKLPSHEGPLVRHTSLSPEELARYEPGQPVTEKGFPYSTLKPDGIDPKFVSAQNTEFQIVSKTGRPVGEYATRPDEVMFPSGTGFMVHDKVTLPNGRVIIQMTEI